MRNSLSAAAKLLGLLPKDEGLKSIRIRDQRHNKRGSVTNQAMGLAHNLRCPKAVILLLRPLITHTCMSNGSRRNAGDDNVDGCCEPCCCCTLAQSTIPVT